MFSQLADRVVIDSSNATFKDLWIPSMFIAFFILALVLQIIRIRSIRGKGDSIEFLDMGRTFTLTLCLIGSVVAFFLTLIRAIGNSQ